MNKNNTSRKSSLLAFTAGLLVLGAAQTARAEKYSCIYNNWCVQQDGSYPAVCETNTSEKFKGSSCGNVCDVEWSDPNNMWDTGTYCMGGCFGKYDSSDSWGNFASTYTCKIATPTASNLQMVFDTTSGTLTADYDISNGYTITDDSTVIFYGASSSSGTGQTTLLTAYYGSQNHITYTNPTNTYAYYKVCVIPVAAGVSSGDNTATGTEVCTGWGNSSETVATTASISISGDTITGSYTYTDNEGAAENTANETYRIQRADDASGTNKTALTEGSSSSDKSWTLTTDENDKYVRFCVIPASVNKIGTSWHCSSWTSVGRLVQLYQDESYGGTNINIAYEKSSSGTCFNLTDYSFNDELTSFLWTSTSTATTTLTLYKDINCSGSAASLSLAADRSGAGDLTGGSFNDQASSIKVTW